MQQNGKANYMAIAKHKITPCLWFDTQAEDAAKFYTGIFKNSRIRSVSRFPDAGKEIHGKDAGSAMVVEFEIEGQTFTALNGGPHFKFSEAVSFQVMCETQDEVDYYWSNLTADGGVESQCGWLKDKFKLSWQIVPSIIPQLMSSGDAARSGRVMNAFMKMKKFDIAALQRAAEGN
jgi:predicted 3-demethylubiquinone-9 3-methyltransferase (glyoxalase superfamily)